MKLILLLFAGALAHGQGRFSATTGDVVLNGATTKFTIQAPAQPGPQIQLEAALVYCSVACDVTQTQNGAAATATAGTVNPLYPYGAAPLATVWTASNVGNGTAAGGIIHLLAGERIVLDLSKMSIGNIGTRGNYTVAISSITGTANITLFWGEK